MLRKKEVLKIIGLSAATLWRLQKAGQFPRSISLTGNRAVGWRESDVVEWMENRPASNNEPVGRSAESV
ncbi:MAG: AlpA family phage regulatory protein [Nitrospinae bacterium]|nr:AlpA family phage regulatory protein [Nitrospinota bacterium]